MDSVWLGKSVIDQADRWLGTDMLAKGSDRNPAESFKFMVHYFFTIEINI